MKREDGEVESDEQEDAGGEKKQAGDQPRQETQYRFHSLVCPVRLGLTPLPRLVARPM